MCNPFVLNETLVCVVRASAFVCDPFVLNETLVCVVCASAFVCNPFVRHAAPTCVPPPQILALWREDLKASLKC